MGVQKAGICTRSIASLPAMHTVGLTTRAGMEATAVSDPLVDDLSSKAARAQIPVDKA